jgi:hypothetical protein
MVKCPEICSEYNKYKDAVDQYDKHCLRDQRSVEKSQVSRKWWHKLYWGLFDGALVNVQILWEMCHGTTNKGIWIQELINEMILYFFSTIFFLISSEFFFSFTVFIS